MIKEVQEEIVLYYFLVFKCQGHRRRTQHHIQVIVKKMMFNQSFFKEITKSALKHGFGFMIKKRFHDIKRRQKRPQIQKKKNMKLKDEAKSLQTREFL